MGDESELHSINNSILFAFESKTSNYLTNQNETITLKFKLQRELFNNIGQLDSSDTNIMGIDLFSTFK